MNLLKHIKQSSRKAGGFVFVRKSWQIKSPFIKLISLLVVMLLTILLYCSGIGCVWRYFFNIPCPGCGMTHALLSALHGDFKGMITHHFMSPSLPVVLIYILYDGHIFRYKWIDNIILIIIASGFLIHWIMEFL